MRSPCDAESVEIDIGTRCHLRCSNCTQLVAHQPRREDIPLERFEHAVRSMSGWRGHTIRITGGEPTLHAQFEPLSRRFAQLWGGGLAQHGRGPIRDFDRFAAERQTDRSTGRSLATSLGPGFARHYETILEVYGHWATNTHEFGGRHQAMLLAREDYQAATGTTTEQWTANRDACAVQAAAPGCINDKGAYFCGVAASIDRLYFDGRHGWPVEPGWWQRTPADFQDQLKLCNYCSLAQPGPTQFDFLGRDILSDRNLERLTAAGSPALRRHRYELFDPPLHSERHRLGAEQAQAGAGRRVGIGNRSIKPRKLSGVVVSVNYAAALAETLPRNIAQFDEFVVVTTAEDHATQALARAHRAKLVISNRCYDDDHAFNKGRMQNDGLRALERPDWIVLTDADIILNPITRDSVLGHALNPGCLYFTVRDDRTAVKHQSQDSNAQPNGYFQLFNPRAHAIRDKWPAPMSEAFCSAGSVDSWFWQQWPIEKIIRLKALRVEHIASVRLGQNWNGVGAVEGHGRWRQLGIMTRDGFSTFFDAAEIPPVIKLTDTRFGDSIVIESNEIDKVVSITPQGLAFLGRDIAQCHIHVAYKA
jgi:hypothetical protein